MVSRRSGRANVSIEKPVLLLVEGNDDYWFFNRLIERRQGIVDIRDSNTQIIQFAQQDKLGTFLADVIVPRLGASIVTVRAIGIVRDADDSYSSARQSVEGALGQANLPVPQTPTRPAVRLVAGNNINVATYIMPDNTSQGDLETLCLKAVRDAEAMPCVNGYFDCLKSIDHLPRQESKARLRAFLAANPADPTLLSGNAIAAGIIPWDSSAFSGVHHFLDLLDAAN